MTEEQIKQNAEEYAKAHTPLDNWETDKALAKFAYIAGAHSCDEEIKELNGKLVVKNIELMEAIAKQALLQTELNELHNPWISVEDRLPKYCTVPSTEQYIKNKRYWDNKTTPIYLVTCSDPQGDYYQFANFLKFPKDKKPSWVFIEDDIKRNCVTHWMPIPELKKGEEECF